MHREIPFVPGSSTNLAIVPTALRLPMDEIKKAFQKYDLDGNGYITAEEAHKVLEAELSFDPDRTKKLIKVYDRNGDGRLSYEEFIWFYWKIQEK